MVLCSLIGGGFSSTMTPDQLAEWLLQEYGKAYKREIDKLTGKSLIGVYTINIYIYGHQIFISCFNQWRAVS